MICVSPLVATIQQYSSSQTHLQKTKTRRPTPLRQYGTASSSTKRRTVSVLVCSGFSANRRLYLAQTPDMVTGSGAHDGEHDQQEDTCDGT